MIRLLAPTGTSNVGLTAGDIERLTDKRNAGLLVDVNGVTLHCVGVAGPESGRQRFVGYMQCLLDFDRATYNVIMEQIRRGKA